jgi:hypothetical protein
MAYATAAELRAYMNKVSTDLDDEINELLESATIAIDNLCNRPNGFVADVAASARLYTGNGKPYLLIDECVEISTVAVKDSASDDDYDTWASDDWIAFSGDHRFPDFNSLPYDSVMVDPTGDESGSVFTSGKWTTRGGFRPLTDTHRGVPTVQITAKWGYATTVPYTIKIACIMQASRWYKRLQSGMSDTLASGELGQMMYTKVIDPDIAMLLIEGRYVKPATGIA